MPFGRCISSPLSAQQSPGSVNIACAHKAVKYTVKYTALPARHSSAMSRMSCPASVRRLRWLNHAVLPQLSGDALHISNDHLLSWHSSSVRENSRWHKHPTTLITKNRL
eukprot:gnl/TRDRNA2_/TRDRNA2_204900_c0_seq1.p1 gnl/TRDRNA2_/TRDRNA2_204900_c0~~gnl/TRDRNA2_/TRDRNA2_204900_c0_seq1.p1  ORF type:complete len:109 (+),score=8.00 gnl/TRDRNA2_/TRDRNA2_204900_c0_seq1:423-749(+)